MSAIDARQPRGSRCHPRGHSAPGCLHPELEVDRRGGRIGGLPIVRSANRRAAARVGAREAGRACPRNRHGDRVFRVMDGHGACQPRAGSSHWSAMPPRGESPPTLRRGRPRRRVTVMIGDASRYLHKVAGPFDLIFQDGDKAPYAPLLDRLVDAAGARRHARHRQRPLEWRGRPRLYRAAQPRRRRTRGRLRPTMKGCGADDRFYTRSSRSGDGVATCDQTIRIHDR